MRFGLDRMWRMMTALGSPQERFDAIHVVGTNGKTSTTRMTAAILERHGLRTGAYTSPHLVSYRERIQIAERDVDVEAFGEAIARAAAAAQRVNRTLAEGDHVTQFELITAAAFWLMAECGVRVAVVEAGLGGRYDATNVMDSRATVLTGVGLEHTRWLGPTVKDIAGEKLAVLRPGTALIHGADLREPVRGLAVEIACERGAARLEADATDALVPALAAKGAFQRQNFALARLAAEVYLAGTGIALGAQQVRAAATTLVPGRMHLLGEDPPTLLDAAHNPDAVAALVDALPAVLGRRPLALVLGVLEDKDAAGMLAPLLAVSERAWFTAPSSPRALSPAALESRARQVGFDAVLCRPRPQAALAGAQAWARERGGAVVATGSVYLMGDLLAELAGGSGTLDEAHLRSSGASS